MRGDFDLRFDRPKGILFGWMAWKSTCGRNMNVMCNGIFIGRGYIVEYRELGIVSYLRN